MGNDGDDIVMDAMDAMALDDKTVNCCNDNEEEEIEITGTESEDVLGFLKKIKATLIHKLIVTGGGMATLNSCQEAETSIVLAIEWSVIGSNKKNLFYQVLCRSPVKSVPQSPSKWDFEWVLEELRKFNATLSSTITITEGIAFMESLALNCCEVYEKVETPIVLAIERRVIDSNKKFDFTYQVLHRLLVKYLYPNPSPSLCPYHDSSYFAVSKCVKNPCDFSIPCKADPPSGIFIPRPEGQTLGYDLVWLDPVTSTPPVPSIETECKFFPCPPPGRFDIISSCNGVYLCSFGNYAVFCLWNPTLKIFTTLPKLDGLDNSGFIDNGLDMSGFIDMTIVYDPSKSPQYQVIALRVKRDPKEAVVYRNISELEIQIAVYSSQTGEWRDCAHEALIIEISTKFHGHGVFCKDAIYWLQPERVVCFNLVQEKLQYIILPTTSMDPERREAITRDFLVKSGRDTLLYVCFSSGYGELLVQELKDLRWSSRYFVDLEMACRSTDLPDCTSFDVVYFMDGENEENGFFVFKANGKVIRFDMASENFYELRYPSYPNHYNSYWTSSTYYWYDSGHRSYCFPFQRVSPSGRFRELDAL